MDTFAPNPPGHWEVTVYATEQPTVAAWADTATPTPARTVPVARAATASRVRGRMEARISRSPFDARGNPAGHGRRRNGPRGHGQLHISKTVSIVDQIQSRHK